MAAAREIHADTPGDINKNNPILLKARDCEAAINALSQAICLNPVLPVYPLHITVYR